MRPSLVRSALAGALLGAAALALVPARALAQSPAFGLRSQFRLLNGMMNGSNNGDARFHPDWVASGPLVTEGANAVTNDLGMSSSSDFTAIADYGDLWFVGYGSASAVTGVGAFLAVDDAVGYRPRVEYVDRLQVTSTTLPAGTPVTLQFEVVLSGGITIADCYPIGSFGAEFSASTPPGLHRLDLARVGVAGATNGTFDVVVGDSVDVHGGLDAGLTADGIRTALCFGSSISANLRAQFAAVPLTPGVTLVSRHATTGVPSAGPVAGLSLDGARPNPARAGNVTLHFALASSEPASLALFDVGGRRVASADVGALGAGSHAVELARGAPLAPGVYLARLRQGRAIRTARVAVTR